VAVTPARVEPRVLKAVSRYPTGGAFDQLICTALKKTTRQKETCGRYTINFGTKLPTQEGKH